MENPYAKDPYFNPRRARAILSGVLLMHVGLIVIPLIYASLTDYFNPPLVVMKVGLADLPLGDSPDAGAVADVPSPNTSEPEPVLDLPPDPQKVDDLPPDIPPPTPKVENPPPKPKTDTKKPVEEPPPKPKDNTKTTVKPPKTDPPKTQTKKDPPKSNLLKPEDIIKPKNTRTPAEIKAEQDAARNIAKARQDALNAIRDVSTAAQAGGRFGTPNPGQDGILANAEMRAYYEQLNSFIRPKWNRVSPSNVEMGASIPNWPVVNLTIGKDGRVTKAVVVKKSGNKVIDTAVDALLADLKVVPVPPQSVVIQVTLDIR